MFITSKKRVFKKIDAAHVLWFDESNYWAQFEEPVWFIYQKLNSAVETEIISRRFSKRYSINIDESKTFVNEVITELEKLSSKTFSHLKTYPSLQFESPKLFSSTRTYGINQKVFEIAYQYKSLENIIHHSISHHELKNKTNPHFRLETFSSASSYILKINDTVWEEDDLNQLKLRLFIEISGLLYNKTNKDWLSFVHGSAVSNGLESIILSTSCGSGKSTMAALLCKQGLQFVSDDFVPIDSRYCKAYPFPAALSVKDGAYPILLPLYKQLETAEIFHFKGTNKTVRYLPFPADKNFYKPLPVRNLVFIQYNPQKTFSFRKVPTLEAIKRFNEEAWVSYRPEHARKFINWFPKLNCYELEYSDNEKAIHAIMDLFKKGF
jgi:hypothetical protein